jgi:hypothetical protein
MRAAVVGNTDRTSWYKTRKRPETKIVGLANKLIKWVIKIISSYRFQDASFKKRTQTQLDDLNERHKDD